MTINKTKYMEIFNKYKI